ncbi:MAG: SoxR reducing system RseC family protein [Bacteroidales bacterium]|jgi:sigma-E factor negative regulatory protein RseC
MRPGHIITHKGVITAINPLKVEIITEGACAGCRAKGYCSLSEKKRKEINRFHAPEGWTPSLGQEVVVSMHIRLGFKALWYGMGIPALLLALSVTSFSLLKMKEWMVGIFAVLCIGIYYFILYLLKHRIQNDFYFTVHRPDS